MFWRIVIGKCNRGVEGSRPEHATLTRKRPLDNRAPRIIRFAAKRAIERTLHGACLRFADDNGQDRRQRIVLGLREQLARNNASVRVLVGKYQQLTRAGGGVDSHHARKLELGLGHVRVSGTDDSIDARHGASAERHRGDRAGTAQGKHAIHPRKVGGGQQHR